MQVSISIVPVCNSEISRAINLYCRMHDKQHSRSDNDLNFKRFYVTNQRAVRRFCTGFYTKKTVTENSRPTSLAHWSMRGILWYGATYHTRTPRQWATQFLGLNLTRACARHLHTSRAHLSSPSTLPHTGFSAVFLFTLLLYICSLPSTSPSTPDLATPP
jgi:hypothetical protein